MVRPRRRRLTPTHHLPAKGAETLPSSLPPINPPPPVKPHRPRTLAALTASLSLIAALLLLTACAAADPTATPAPTPIPATPTPAGPQPLAPPTTEQLGGGSPQRFMQIFDQGRAESPFRPTAQFAAAAQLNPGETLKIGIIFTGSQRDLGWNQASAIGADYLEQTLPNIQIIRAENIPETAEVQEVAQQMIREGATIIIATSFGFSGPIKAIINQHPEIMFLHLGDLEIHENYGSFFANIWQLQYAAGRAAGQTTQTGKLGFIAAFPIPSSLLNINAFHLGAQSVNPNIQTTVVMTNDWCDPGKQVTAVQTLTAANVDVLSLQQDCTKTVIDAAERVGVWVSGFHYDASDAAPGRWLTGASWNWGPIMAQIIHEIRTGAYQSSVMLAGIDAGWAKLSTIGNAVPDHTRQLVLDTVTGLRNGTISPFTGPIYDQNGQIRIPPGETAPDSYLQAVDWLAQGITGRTN